jgi:hypothetical protein
MGINIHSVTPTGYGDHEHALGYKFAPNCSICRAVDRKKKPARDAIDEYIIGHTTKEIIIKLLEYGLMQNEKQITTHIQRHAPYILVARKNGSKKIQKMVVRIHQEKVEVSEALQRIVDIGDSMVQTGDMPVTERLYVEALKEQGRRGVKTSLDTEFETLDSDFINKMKNKNALTT